MNGMKKILVYLLLAAICLGVVSCGEKLNEENNSIGSTEATVTQSDSTSDESESKSESESDSVVTESEATSSKENEPEESNPEESITEETKLEETKPEETKPEETESEESEPEESEFEIIEPEDTRLEAEYAPVTYFSAADIYYLTKDGVYEDMAQLFFGYDEVTYHYEEGSKPYVKLLAYNDYQTSPEAYISLCTGKMVVAPVFAVKYRTTSNVTNMEIYTDSVNVSVVSKNSIRIPIEADGEWHVEYVNLRAIKDFNGEYVNYFRFDFMNASILPVDSYVEFEYIGFFNSEEEVEMFETGKYTPVVYIDPASGYKESTITHASSIDMINGAGGATAEKFDYRGGNSLKGIDKFNHNATTLSDGKLVFSGWTVVDGGIEKFVWSVDGLNWYPVSFHQMSGLGNVGDDHINATENYTGATILDRVNSIKGGGYQGNVNATTPMDRAKGLACDLLTVAKVGDKVNVRFAAVPKNAPDELCLIAYVKNVEVVEEFVYEEEIEEPEIIDPTIDPSECVEHQGSKYWYPVEGELKEVKLCLLCGTAVDERTPAFYSSLDIIEDKNGSKNTGLYGANKTFDKDGSYILLRDGYDFVLQGWFACNGGVLDYVYSTDGGETWLVAGNSNNLTQKFGSDHKAAIKKADLGITDYDVKGMYRVNLPLKHLAGDNDKTVDILFGAIPLNNDAVVITIAKIKGVKIPALVVTPEPEKEIKFLKAINDLNIGGTNIHNPNGGYGGELFTYDAQDIIMTSTTIKWIGWAGVDDGVSKWVYSTDGGNTWKDASGSAITITDSKMLEVINGAGLTNATAKGSFASSGIVADLSDLPTSTVEVIFAAVPIADTTKVIPMVKIINVNILNTCSHSNVASWSPVEGQLKECGVCAGCGETVERDTTFVVCVDKVVYAGGTRAWKANSAGSDPYVVADVEIMQADIN